MAAIAILLIIVASIGTIFNESDRAWQSGTGLIQNSAAGREAIATITRDLQHAIADDLLTFHMERSTNTIYGMPTDEAYFVSLVHNSADTNRAAREFCYWVEAMTDSTGSPLGRYQLVRGQFDTELTSIYTNHAYYSTNWYLAPNGQYVRPDVSGPIAANIAAFRLAVPTGGDDPVIYNSQSNSNQLPAYVDVYLEILNDNDAEAIEDMARRGIDYTNFLERTAIRYTARVFLQNRYGYGFKGR